ncbi:MAG TPA: hypothetical protein VD788_09435 [Candidatus Polarisedimenticolaceae bacterium]|nr:hypothetical protein [Candidatus Polarisedimenticolaceae bacterium]
MSLVSQVVLALQVGSVGVGLAPQIRVPLRRVSWFVGLIVGPPLLWTLCATSVDLVLSFESMHHFSLDPLYAWLLKLPTIIGTTLFLQCLLAWQYADSPMRSLPIVGVAFGLLAILGDVVFVLCMVTALGP